MKKTTKTAAVVLAMTMAFATMTACGSKTADDAAQNATSGAVESSETVAASSAEAPAPAAEGGKIVFATNPEFPPFEYITTEGVLGEYDGIDMAIAKAIGEQNGMEVEMQSLEFDSLIVALQNGQIDAVIAGMTITEERAEQVDFSTPYYVATQVMIVKEDSDITCAADMEGKKICVIQGYTGETCVSDLGYPYESFKKGTEAVMELANGKCDVVVIDSATAAKYVGDTEGLKIVEDPEVFGAEQYGIAVSKGNTELLDKINASVESMLADGTIADLAVSYTEAQ